MNRETLKDCYRREKADEEKRREFFAYAIYRPLSFLVTPLFLRAGFSATGVSLLVLALSASMPAVALARPERAYLWLALISFCCLLLDCVDGNVARARKASSSSGRYVDSVVGKAYQVLSHVSLGLVAAHEVPRLHQGYWLSLALATALLYVWSRESRSYSKLYLFGGDEVFAAGSFGVKHVIPSLPDLLPFALLLFGIVSAVHWILCGLALLFVLDFTYTQITILTGRRP